MSAFVKSLTLFSTLFLLLACGGGGSLEREGDGSTPTPTPTPPTDPEYSLSLMLSDPANQPSNQLSADTPLTVNATVTDGSGNAVEGTLVTFAFSNEGLATFSNDSGTALTNSDGIASIGLQVGENSGSGIVTATLESGETEQIGFTSQGTVVVEVEPASLSFFASRSQLPSSGSDEVELWAIVKNDQNVLLPGVKVNFSANNDASIQDTQSTTDEDGVARVILRTGGDYENRIITTTAAIANNPTLTKQLEIAVVGTSININGSDSVIVRDDTSLTITLVDSDNRGINNKPVTLTVTDSAANDVTQETLNTTTVTTDSEGRATVTFNAGASDSYTVTANALGAMASFVVNVQEDEFGFINPPDVTDVNDDIPLNTSQTLRLQWLKEGMPYQNGEVNLTISRGTISPETALTNVNGEVAVSVQSDNAGEATIVALGTDTSGAQVSSRLNIAFIATEAATIVVDATPDAIGPDGQTSTISAVVRDPQGNRVRNKLINFSVNDVSNGSLTDAQSRTDKRGIATTVYVSNAITATESVTVTATVDDNTSVSSSATLTVGDRPYDISIGTGRLISLPTDSSYEKEFSVFVTDADGNPVANAPITFSALPLKASEGNTFYKGYWVWNEETQIHTYNDLYWGCPNEDINFNGMLDFVPASEDTNGDNMLTPGNMAAIDETVTTDENGQALVYLRYAKHFGGWATVRITARSESGGTESRESMIYELSVAFEDLTVEGSPPPPSPYGQEPNCSTYL